MYFKKLSGIFLMMVLSSSLSVSAMQKTLIDSNWRFALNEQKGAEAENFNDSGWRIVNLPHDFSIEGVPEKDNPSGNDGGYYPTGLGWYRNMLNISPKQLAGKLWLYFEGVYERSTVYVNGKQVGGHPYGYTSFFCDITEAVKPGKNIVAVRADNSHQKNCRWYTGSGITRHVWLLTSDKLHFDNHGVSIFTPSLGSAKIIARVTNESNSERIVTVNGKIGDIGRSSSKDIRIAPGNSVSVTLDIALTGAKPWSPDSPFLYNACVSIEENGKTIDTYSNNVGVRTVKWSAENGLLLNGKPINLSGGCVHADNGILGAAGFDRAEERRVRLLKDAGFNAVRTSHNPPTEAFLDACDRIGLMVIDEVFDGWRERKNEWDYSTLIDEWGIKDLRSFVKRDINHPSIFCWSTGNEVIERKNIEVVKTAHNFTKAVHEIDPLRPVTSALASWDNQWDIYDPLAAEHDIVGYNYLINYHESDHQRVPDRVMMQTESYPRDAFDNWTKVNDYPYIIGDFVWTAMDYLGESGIGKYWYDREGPGDHFEPGFPMHGAYCGDIDLIGWRKPISHYRDMIYNGKHEQIYMAVREPSGYYGEVHVKGWGVWPTWERWTWNGWEGKDTEIEVYSKYPKVRLYLNDKLIGEKSTGRDEKFMASFTVPYRPGTIRAEGVAADGTPGESMTLSTAGEPAAIRIIPDRTQLTADGQDLSFITVEVVDADERIVPDAAADITVTISGNMTMAGAGSADMTDLETYADNKFRTWKGRGMVVVRSSEKSGKTVVTVAAKNLKTAKAVLTANKK